MFRDATDKDLIGLRDLEREANLAALDHIFPPERFPFPGDDVLARWRLVMDDPSTSVRVADDPEGGLIACSAYDDTTLRHLAVRPDHWGQGIASTAVEAALHAMDLRGSTVAWLWCLEENHRARRLYHYLGWRPTGARQPAPWPPYPTEMEYTRLIVESER